MDWLIALGAFLILFGLFFPTVVLYKRIKMLEDTIRELKAKGEVDNK